MHEWRKRTKDAGYHVRLLRDAAPSILEPLEDRFHDLSDALGDAHDLVVICERLRAVAGPVRRPDPGPRRLRAGRGTSPPARALGHAPRRPALRREAEDVQRSHGRVLATVTGHGRRETRRRPHRPLPAADDLDALDLEQLRDRAGEPPSPPASTRPRPTSSASYEPPAPADTGEPGVAVDGRRSDADLAQHRTVTRPTRRFVVWGPPASGGSTLAPGLASQFRIPLIAKTRPMTPGCRSYGLCRGRRRPSTSGTTSVSFFKGGRAATRPALKPRDGIAAVRGARPAPIHVTCGP